MSRFFWLAAAFALTACANNEVIIGPDGTENRLIRCMNIESCYSDARA